MNVLANCAPAGSPSPSAAGDAAAPRVQAAPACHAPIEPVHGRETTRTRQNHASRPNVIAFCAVLVIGAPRRRRRPLRRPRTGRPSPRIGCSAPRGSGKCEGIRSKPPPTAVISTTGHGRMTAARISRGSTRRTPRRSSTWRPSMVVGSTARRVSATTCSVTATRSGGIRRCARSRTPCACDRGRLPSLHRAPAHAHARHG